MAQRRMFSLKVIDTDEFIDMPITSRLLYYDLSMRADDDGFVSSPKKIQRMCGCSDDDLKLLVAKQFIIPFESGICVIKHWRLHNYIQKDRYAKTMYAEEFNKLNEIDGIYSLDTKCIQNVSKMDTQVRLGKDRLEIELVKENILSDVIGLLNAKLGTNYTIKNQKTKSCIQARINEGFTLQDFETVIEKKCKEWQGTDYEKYLRPETLFGTKFESYLNQRVVKKQSTMDKLQELYELAREEEND